MPQVFQVLCCYQCEMFQVHQVKKSNKWHCRGCNAKQSLKKAFKIGAARDCRFLVQELNMRKCGFPLQLKQDSEYCDDAFNEEFQEASNIFKKTENEYSNLFAADSDEMTLEDDNRCLSDSDLEVSEKNQTAITNHFLPGNSFVTETPCCQLNSKTAISETFDTEKQHVQVLSEKSNFKNVQKRPIETTEFEKDMLPRYKKNKGFKMILNAASKLS